MSNLIDRQAAIDALHKEWDEVLVYDDSGSGIADICESVLESLSSAESNRKKGKWVYDGIRGRFPACKCSICGYYENADWALLQGANYCPHCGADMRGDDGTNKN